MIAVHRETLDPGFWHGRNVLLTGHTGFKGAWMALLLSRMGARVTGVSLPPGDENRLHQLLSQSSDLRSLDCDIRDADALRDIVRSVQPEIVIHMAAQALVGEAYADPLATIRTNVIGTVNLLEPLRVVEALSSVLVITSDKVYENREHGIDFSENAALGGHDPYSASKAAAEVLTSAYRRSFFVERGVTVMTARAGNVIGGGDWAPNRLVPDLWRAYESKSSVLMRNPGSVRPWQHVLDPLLGYLLLVQRSVRAPAEAPAALNFGPPREPVRTVLQVAEAFSKALGAGALWTSDPSQVGFHESKFLSIDSSLAMRHLGWRTSLPVDDAIEWTGRWYRSYSDGEDMRSVTNRQIDAYLELVGAPVPLEGSLR